MYLPTEMVSPMGHCAGSLWVLEQVAMLQLQKAIENIYREGSPFIGAIDFDVLTILL